MAYVDRYGNTRKDLWEQVQEQHYGIQPEYGAQPPDDLNYAGLSPEMGQLATNQDIVGTGEDPLNPLQQYIADTPEGQRRFTNLPGRGGGYHFMPEDPVQAPVPGGYLQSTYDLEDDQGEPLVETPEDYIRERGAQEQEAAGLYNEMAVEQAIRLKGGDKSLSAREQMVIESIKNKPDLIDNLMQRMAEMENPQQRQAIWNVIKRELGVETTGPPTLGPPPTSKKELEAQRERLHTERSERAFSDENLLRLITELTPRQLAGSGRMGMDVGLSSELAEPERQYGPIGIFR